MPLRRSKPNKPKPSSVERISPKNSANLKVSAMPRLLKKKSSNSTKIGKISQPINHLFGSRSGTQETPTAVGSADKWRKKTKSKDKAKRKHF
jgi:hypothetical protein